MTFFKGGEQATGAINGLKRAMESIDSGLALDLRRVWP
jgi:hypothetical protein